MRRWTLVGLLAATATASYLCRVNVSVAGVLMMKELGLDQIEMGRVFSAFFPGYALCHVPAGMLADRLGARHCSGSARRRRFRPRHRPCRSTFPRRRGAARTAS